MPRKAFKIDDKVFAKVKGYPSWPAKITGVNGMRYSVQFYGTNETATVAENCIQYYLANRGLNAKFKKRKSYKDAVDEIEDDIEVAGGTDGSPAVGDEPEESPVEQKTTSKKRKRNSTKGETPKQAAKILKTVDVKSSEVTSVNSQENTEEKQEVNGGNSANDSSCVDESDSMIIENNQTNSNFENKEEQKVADDNSRQETNEDESDKAVVLGADSTKENEKISEENEKLALQQIDLKNINLIQEFYLTAIKHYADWVRNNAKLYEEKPPDSSSLDDSEDSREKVLPVKVNHSYCGIKFIPKQITSFKSEFERALNDEEVVNDILQLKETIVTSSTIPKDDRIIENLGCDDKYVSKMHDLSLVAYKKNKKEWLQRETELYKNIVGMKKCLAIDGPNVKEALHYLDNILNMDIDPVMLKKHAHFMDSLQLVTKYVGDKFDEELPEEKESEYVNDCLNIQLKAKSILVKFKTLFSYGEKEDFVDLFKKECEVFKEFDKENFELFSDPLSRKGRMDIIYETLNKSQEAINDV